MSAVLKKRSTKSVIYHEVEFDLAEFDDEDLIAELESRGHSYEPSIEEMFLAMKFKNHTKALELLRLYLMNQTGRILP